MALINKIELSSGIVCDNAYIKILSVNGSKELISIQIQGYVNKEAYTSGKECFFCNYYSFKPSVTEGSENFIKQAYQYLKTLEEFATAKDDV